MTRPGEFDDVNEAVGSEWADGTTPVERIHDVISHRYTPTSADEIAETARTSPEIARKRLEELAEEGFIQTKTDEDGTTTYRRAPRSIVMEQASEILNNTTTDELAARVDEMRERVEQEDSKDKRERQTTRRNLAVANAALAIAEASRVVDGEFERRRRAAQEELRQMFETIDKDYDAHTDIESPIEDVDEDELSAEIEELENELTDCVDKT